MQGWTEDYRTAPVEHPATLDNVGTPVMEVFLRRDEHSGRIVQQVRRQYELRL